MPIRKQYELCEKCRAAAEATAPKSSLTYLVHPTLGSPGIFDKYGHADCPECGARWHRGPHDVTLVPALWHRLPG